MAYAAVGNHDVDLETPATPTSPRIVSSEKSKSDASATIFSSQPVDSKVPAHADVQLSSSTTALGASRPPWIPYTLRWPFLTLLVALSLGLCAITAALTSVSGRQHGLGNDDGSGGLLFGWRFTPTVIAVIYAHLVSMVFNDFRRTEPFARMAQRATPASSSVLQAPQAWWKMFAQSLSRKRNGGRVNWPMAAATTIFVLATLAISSLSSSFLTTEDVFISRQLQLTKRMLPVSAPVTLQATPDTFLGTTSSLLYNLSISPWTIDEYTVLPFWPEGEDPDAFLNRTDYNKTETWEAVTSIFKTEYRCSIMTVSTSFNNTKRFTATGTPDRTKTLHPPTVLVNGTSKMDTTLLGSDDGCQYQFDMAPTLMTNRVSSVSWARADSSLYDIGMSWASDMDVRNTSGSWIYTPGNESYSLDKSIGPTSPYLRFNSSSECTGKDIMILSTELFVSSGQPFLPNYTQKAWECELSITTAALPVTMVLGGNPSSITFDRDAFSRTQVAVAENALNLTDVRVILHSSNWLSYLDPATFSADRSALLLSAEYGYDFDAMMSAEDLPSRAQKTVESFFAALVQTSLSLKGASDEQSISGESTTETTRIKVLQGVGVALAVLFGLNACLLAALAWQCTSTHRPLNLASNPSTTEGVIDLIAAGHWDKEIWKPLSIASREELERSLRAKSYAITHKLQESDNSSGLSAPYLAHDIDMNKTVHDWKPTTLRVSSLVSLLVYLILFAIAISVLYDYATGNQLYRRTFIYEVDVANVAGHIAQFTPFSIIPTFLAIVVTMWWDGITQKFCQLQPSIAMTKPEGTKWHDGPGLHYNGVNWTKSAYRAFTNRHWLLFLIVVGNILTQFLTISASALFERKTGFVSSDRTLNRSLELRQLPFSGESRNSIVLDTIALSDQFNKTIAQISDLSAAELEQVFPLYDTYWVDDASWMYSATNQLARGGEEPAWSLDGWSFMPVELPDAASANYTYSISTQAVKGRVDCSTTSEGYDLPDPASWLVTYNMTNSSTWNISANPQDIEHAYFFRTLSAYGTPFSYDEPLFPFCASYNGTPGVIGGGRWNDFAGKDTIGRFPYRFSTWPINFTATWILGDAQANFLTRNNIGDTMTQYDVNLFPVTFCDQNVDTRFNVSMFTEIPMMQSLNCRPVIENAEVKVTVDPNGKVSAYQIVGEPQETNEPWEDVFQMYTTNSSDVGYAPSYSGLHNQTIASSYGISFLSSLLKAPSMISQLSSTSGRWSFDSLYPNAGQGNSTSYFIRDYDNNLGMDLMTYCIYTLAGKNATTLATDAKLFTNLVGKTFQTFFQHFVSGSLNGTASAYQSINSTFDDLGQRVVFNSNTGLVENADPIIYPAQQSNSTSKATASQKVELLKMNAIATWLAFGILIWLVLTTIAITALHRRFLSPLHRNIECLADVMTLIAGSEHLLALAKERGLQGLIQDDSLRVRLGWFREVDGKLRWGIELLDTSANGEGIDVVWVEHEEAIGIEGSGKRVSTGLIKYLGRKQL